MVTYNPQWNDADAGALYYSDDDAFIARLNDRPKTISVTVAFPRGEVNMGEPMFRRITFSKGSFQECMEAAESFGWTGKIVHLKLDDRTVILNRREEERIT